MHLWSDVKVLLVDNDLDSRGSIRAMLAQLEITQVFEADDIGDALNFIASGFGDLDLVITDWSKQETGVNGLELKDQVRGIGSELPFLIVTEKRDEFSVNKAKDEGITYYIGKPYSVRELERKLKVIIRKEIREAKKISVPA